MSIILVNLFLIQEVFTHLKKFSRLIHHLHKKIHKMQSMLMYLRITHKLLKTIYSGKFSDISTSYLPEMLSNSCDIDDFACGFVYRSVSSRYSQKCSTTSYYWDKNNFSFFFKMKICISLLSMLWIKIVCLISWMFVIFVNQNFYLFLVKILFTLHSCLHNINLFY